MGRVKKTRWTKKKRVINHQHRCVNCSQPVADANFHREFQLDNNNDHQNDKTATFSVKDVIFCLYHLDYMEEVNNGKVHDDDASNYGVCDICLDMLIDVYKFWTEFNLRRASDSLLLQKIYQQDQFWDTVKCTMTNVSQEEAGENNSTKAKEEDEMEIKTEDDDSNTIIIIQSPSDITGNLYDEMDQEDESELFSNVNNNKNNIVKEIRGNDHVDLDQVDPLESADNIEDLPGEEIDVEYEKCFQCRKCSKRFKTASNLVTHANICLDLRVEVGDQCSLCQRSFLNLKKHMERVHQNKVPVTRRRRKRKQRKCPSPNKLEEEDELSSKYFICVVAGCGQEFRLLSAIKEHMMTSHCATERIGSPILFGSC